MRTRGEVLREVPDSYYAKQFLPLCDNLLTLLRLTSDWDEQYDQLEMFVAENIHFQLDNSINISQSGNLTSKQMKQTVCNWGYPPILPIRMDMQNLSTKMIYGPSVDISFVCLSDIDREAIFVMNLHVEDSIPQKWWFISKSSDPYVFDRRHMKYGTKLRDLGKKVTDNVVVARQAKDILQDIRNEREPQWADSVYYICIFSMMGAMNTTLEFSNWDSMGLIWDGVNSQRYGLSSNIFVYEPLPPILKLLFDLDRSMWIERTTNLLMGGQLYLRHTEKNILNNARKQSTELYEVLWDFYTHQLDKGIPLPSQTLQCDPPRYNPETQQWEKMGFDYPAGPRIDYRELGLTVEDVLNGVLLDINHKSQVEKVTRDHIVSLGHGFDTTYLR